MLRVYDFDKTIYKNDSTLDLYLYMVKKKPYILVTLPITMFYAILYKLNLITKDVFKEKHFIFLNMIDINVSRNIIKEFWDTHIDLVFPYYMKQKTKDDVVISASPRFSLEYALSKLGVTKLICSEIDLKTGKLDGYNCFGEAKIKKFYEIYGEGTTIDEFYSDSLSDTPLANISKKAFIIDKNGIVSKWPNHKECYDA